MSNAKLKFIVVLGSVVFTLLAAEVGVRIRDAVVGVGFFSNHRNQIRNAKLIVPFLTFGFPLYVEKDGERFISSVHKELYPLRKAPGTIRIVTFGGSTTANNEVMEKHGTHYPLLLQTKLREHFARNNIEVINVGNPAYATPHCLILLSIQVLSWEPDIVILSENANDLTAAYFPGITFDYANKYSHGAYTLANLSSRHSLSNILLQHFQLYWLTKKRLQNLEYKYDSRYRIQRVSYGDQPPSGAHAAYKRNLHSFVTLAKKNGVQVILGTQPLEESEEYFRLHMGFKPYNNVVKYPLHSEFIAHHKTYNQTIREVAKEESVYLADNDTVFNNNRAWFVDFAHYTLEGANRLAENYARVLIDYRLVQ